MILALILAASTVAIVAIAAVIIVALIALIYIGPRGARRRRLYPSTLSLDLPASRVVPWCLSESTRSGYRSAPPRREWRFDWRNALTVRQLKQRLSNEAPVSLFKAPCGRLT